MDLPLESFGLAGAADSAAAAPAPTAIPLYVLTEAEFPGWLAAATPNQRQWAQAPGAKPRAGEILPVYGAPGQPESYIAVVAPGASPYAYAFLPGRLPVAAYALANALPAENATALALGWALGRYQFTAHKTARAAVARHASLLLPPGADGDYVRRVAAAAYLARDLVNEPANHLGPAKLAAAAIGLAQQFRNASASAQVVTGPHDYPLIHGVGRAAAEQPRLVDIRWGNPADPQVTLIGKGVIYDTGGLSLKSLDGMVTMKKDMGGAAHALALAALVMEANLPVNLQVLLPIVENSINERAFRNGDVLKSRGGRTVEIANTDAEGRLILADAFAAAGDNGRRPELLVDFATLTAAARTVGEPGTPVVFGTHKETLRRLEDIGAAIDDPLQPIRLDPRNAHYLSSAVADIRNSGPGLPSHLMAAHFLRGFLPPGAEWIHIDQSAWAASSAPGKPAGGVDQGLRTMFDYLRARYPAKPSAAPAP
jgi:leucyl aminopeptidase